jgi:cytochrome c oxidase cbb3-type subunit 3
VSPRPFIAIGLLTIAACGQPKPQASAPSLALLPNGDLAGAAQSEIGAQIANPLADRPDAVTTGKQLYVKMNCAGCHGYDLGGAMGPNLSDSYWRYGGSPAAIYRSIATGHPQGMPAWSKALTAGQIWSLVAYIQSKGGATAPSDYQAALQGDLPSKTAPRSPGGGAPGAHTGAKGSTAHSGQPPNP